MRRPSMNQGFDEADERAPLPALDEEYAGRSLGPGDLVIHRPLEVLVVDVEISDPVERAARKPLRLPDGAPGFRIDPFQLLGRGAKTLRAKRLAGYAPTVFERHHFHRTRVERHDAVPQNKREKADDHQYAESERAAHDPDERLSSGFEVERCANTRPARWAFPRFGGLRHFGCWVFVVARVISRNRHLRLLLFFLLFWIFRLHPILTTARRAFGSAGEPPPPPY